MSTPTTNDRRIVARGLTRAFGAKTAVHPTDLDLGPGGVIGLLGPNGGGKSTLLRMLVGLVPRDAGSASIAGVALAGDGLAVRRVCAYAPGEIALYGEVRGRELLGWLLRGRERESIARAVAFADALALPLAKRVRAYSHGMKRQLLLSAALAPRVPVRILDEPSEGLDPTKRGAVLDLLVEDARAGTTVLISSHHLGEVDRACDRLVFMDAGRVIADETSASVARRARTIVRVTYANDADHARIAARFASIEGARVVRDGARYTLHLASDDPRALLAAIAADVAVPAEVEYGRLSLPDLYRDLYGVEGV